MLSSASRSVSPERPPSLSRRQRVKILSQRSLSPLPSASSQVNPKVTPVPGVVVVVLCEVAWSAAKSSAPVHWSVSMKCMFWLRLPDVCPMSSLTLNEKLRSTRRVPLRIPHEKPPG